MEQGGHTQAGGPAPSGGEAAGAARQPGDGGRPPLPPRSLPGSSLPGSLASSRVSSPRSSLGQPSLQALSAAKLAQYRGERPPARRAAAPAPLLAAPPPSAVLPQYPCARAQPPLTAPSPPAAGARTFKEDREPRAGLASGDAVALAGPAGVYCMLPLEAEDPGAVRYGFAPAPGQAEGEAAAQLEVVRQASCWARRAPRQQRGCRAGRRGA